LKNKGQGKVTEHLIHLSLTSGLNWGKWSALHPGWFTLGERAPGTHQAEGWEDCRACLDISEKRRISCLYWESNHISSII